MRAVADAMTSVPILDASTTIQDAAAAMLDCRVEAAVIVDGEKLRGLLTASDVAAALAEGRDAGSTPPSFSVRSTASSRGVCRSAVFGDESPERSRLSPCAPSGAGISVGGTRSWAWSARRPG